MIRPDVESKFAKKFEHLWERETKIWSIVTANGTKTDIKSFTRLKINFGDVTSPLTVFFVLRDMPYNLVLGCTSLKDWLGWIGVIAPSLSNRGGRNKL